MSARAIVPEVPQHTAARRVGVAAIPRHLFLLILAGYACLLPREFTLSIFGAAFPPYRLVLVACIPFILYSFRSGQVRLRRFDAVVFFAALWFPIALANTATFRDVIVIGGSQGIDYPLSYLLGRVSIRRYSDVTHFFKALLPGLAVLALVLAAEALGNRLLLRPLAAQIVGLPPPELYERQRLGLLRAMGPFPHPILAGLFMTSVLPFAWYVLRSPVQKITGLTASAFAVFTVSSAAVLNAAIGIGAIILTWLQRISGVPVWWLVIFAGIVIAAFIEIASGNGFVSFILRYVTLDSGTGFYRRLIWQYAGAEALAHPFFGIGLRDWERLSWMTESIDSFWLLLATRYGMPLPAMLMVLMVGAAIICVRQAKGRSLYNRNMATAFAIAIGAMVVAGFTVFIWENMICWVLLLCGMAVSLGMDSRKRRTRRRTRRRRSHAGSGDRPQNARG